MLPSDPDARRLFFDMRDCRNRHREMLLMTCGGDMEALRAKTLDDLQYESELATFLELVDFARSNGWLDEAQLEAANNAIAWAKAVIQ